LLQGGLDKYIKKKQMDPLSTYLPSVLVAQSQLLDVPEAAETFGLEPARSLLREGAFVGLRDNVRVIGEYAVQSIGKDAAKAQVTAFFKAIEELDLALFQVCAHANSCECRGNCFFELACIPQAPVEL
jgi:hypothetical protein